MPVARPAGKMVGFQEGGGNQESDLGRRARDPLSKCRFKDPRKAGIRNHGPVIGPAAKYCDSAAFSYLLRITVLEEQKSQHGKIMQRKRRTATELAKGR